jgi:hypothetical protein
VEPPDASGPDRQQVGTRCVRKQRLRRQLAEDALFDVLRHVGADSGLDGSGQCRLCGGRAVLRVERPAVTGVPRGV